MTITPVAELGILDAVARQARIAGDTAHRPWPLPGTPWAQAQTRHDILLAYWRAPIDVLARLLPADWPPTPSTARPGSRSPPTG